MAIRPVLPLLAALVLFSGCDAAAPPSEGPTAGLRVGFAPRGIVDTITVEAVDRLPLRAATLVAPDGTITPASNINVTETPRVATGQYTLTDPWRGAVLGGQPAAPVVIPDPTAGAALQAQQQLLAIVSTADLPLPDSAAYRRDWASYRIRLTFGTPPGQIETREVPAPAPPPGS